MVGASTSTAVATEGRKGIKCKFARLLGSPDMYPLNRCDIFWDLAPKERERLSKTTTSIPSA
jgi:hypothetical protein